jgi:hypothetical protein
MAISMPCVVTRPALSLSPEEREVAMRGVVAVARKLKTRKEKVKRAEQIPRAARGSAPPDPTKAVSTMLIKGSAAKASRAGAARLMISASCLVESQEGEKKVNDGEDGEEAGWGLLLLVEMLLVEGRFSTLSASFVCSS